MDPDHLDDMIRRSDDHVGAEPDENRPDAADDQLICSSCRTIGNADDLAFLGEPCPRSWYEDDDCDGVMVAYSPTAELHDNDSVAGSHISWRRVGGEPIMHISTNPAGYNLNGATMLAHAILSEVEIALRERHEGA